MHNKGLRQDLIVILVLFMLPFLFFWSVTFGGKTLLPADNAFSWEPWKTYAAQMGVTVPHNSLLSDLYLENYVWKQFIVESLRARQLPLWNPYLFAGVPFLAAGQHSMFYPLSVIFYVLPLSRAYGWFAAIHLFLAGLFTYLLAKTLRIGRVGAMLAAFTFMFAGFTVTHNVFPMIIASVVWLPAILALIERTIQRAEEGQSPLLRYLPDLVLGALAFGMVFLAGHPEMYYYVCLTSGLYALWRLVGLWKSRRHGLPTLYAGLGLLAMVLVGAGVGAAQWAPMLELLRTNFREGSASFQQVLGWAYPKRHALAFLIPDVFGNPAHHSYFDLFTWRNVAVTVNALKQQINTIDWGIKNYVEGACYVGVLPLVLTLVAVLRRQGRHIWFFAGLALLSLLFVFGSPLYILVFKLPGLNQVHSPFRWIFPYTLCIAILAGMGAEALWQAEGQAAKGWWQRLANRWAERMVPLLTLLGGLVVLGGLALSLFFKERVASLADKLIQRLAKAPEAFADGRMAYSYEFRNLLIFGGALLLGGLVLVLRHKVRRKALWGALAGLVIVGELFIVGHSFFPAVDARLVGMRTPAIDFLKADTTLYRITSYVGGDEKTLNANTAWMYDIADVRGYDSAIPRQYVEYMRLIQEQGELPYNRIAPIFASHPEALDSPLLDLLNVKYVLTTKERTIQNQGYTLVYDQEIRIYRNDSALPRAFLVPKAVSIPDAEERRQALVSLNPREQVILEEAPRQPQAEQSPADFNSQVESIDYTPNEVVIVTNSPTPAFLVLGDSFYHGWLAFIRPFDAPNPQEAEKASHIYRADGNFRAVQVPAGHWVVRFKYSPNVVKYGLYISFLAATILALVVGLWGWLRFSRGAEEEGSVKRVTKNTVTPIVLSLVNKVIDMAFAMLMLRILGPVNAGEFYFAITVISWFDIITNFGLNTLLTREVAKDKEHANRFLTNTTILRLALCGLSVPVLTVFFLARSFTSPLNPATILAISLFGIGLIPSNISAGLTASFNAYERMEIPAFVAILTVLLKVSLGTVALVLGQGYVGLAGVSILNNLITMLILYVLVRRMLFRPRLEVDFPFQKEMLRASYPLMINHLLATLFFKVAVTLLEAITKNLAVVGWYSTAYKYIDAIGVIPAYFTIAIFPLMSRYAANAKGSLLKAYQLAVKLLLIIAMPLAVIGWGLSHEMILLLGGSQYLPQGADILRVMIWYLPFGFINSVTQYVLIALDQQRFLTRAFLIGLGFNVLANVFLINRFGYMASAYIAIASEIVLFVPFYIGIRRHLANIPWLKLLWKQAVSILPMAAFFTLVPHRYLPLSFLGGAVLYGVGLWLLGVFDEDEQRAVGDVLRLGGLKARVARALGRSVD